VVICSFYALKPSTDQEIAARISDNVKDQVQLAQKDFELVTSNLKAPSEISLRTHFPFFIFGKDSILFWSANNFVPSASMAKGKEVQMVKSGGGVYLLVRKSIDRHMSVVSAIMLQREYLITNDYLNQEYNSDIFSSTDIRVVEPESLSGVAINFRNETLFKVLALPRYNAHDPVMVWIGIVLTCTLVVMLLFLFWNVASRIATKSVAGSIVFLIALCWIII
jgi:hypothetical protein